MRGCVVGDVELDDRVSRHNDGAMLLDVWCGGADAGVAGVGHHRVRGACAWRGGADVVEELHEDVVNGARIHASQITPELNSEHCAGV